MPKYNVSRPVSGYMPGSIVQACPVSGLLAITLQYKSSDSILTQKTSAIEVLDSGGTRVALKAYSEFTLVTFRLHNPGIYTVKVISDWSPPINVVYQAEVALDRYTSVVIPLRIEDPLVPKVIHFVWAGGKKLLPPGNIDAVKEWAIAHRGEGFEAWIWIDETISPGTRARYADFGFPSLDPVVKLPDITEQGVSSPHARYEIDRLRSNYGASSDMLRYNILYRFGGAYFDSDVHPGARTLNYNGMFDRMNRGLFLVDNNSQRKGLIGNDTFICGAGNLLMRAIAAAAEENYRRPFRETGNRVYGYDEPSYMQNCTILKTGPMAVAETLHAKNKLRAVPQAPRTSAAT